MTHIFRALFVFALLTIAFTSRPVHAADGTWAVDADGNWGDTGNWAGGVVPDDSLSKAFFTNNISATRTVTLEASHTSNAPEFSDNGAAGSGWVVAGPGQLNLSGTAIFRTPTTISANISATSFSVSGGSRLTLTGNNSVSSVLGIALGVVNAVDGVGLPTAANLQFVSPNVAAQAILEGNGTFTRKTGSGAGQVRWASNLSSGGWAASGGVFNISLTNSSDVPGGALTWGAGGFVSTGPVTLSQFQLNSTTADNLVDFQNAIALGSSTRGITVFDNPASTADRARLSGVISGTATLQKNGAGTLELTNSNTYGPTTISAGTLQIGSGGTTGSLGTGSVTNNAALVFNRSDAITVSNAISGTGSVTQSGAGTTTLTGVNTYGGGTTVSSGTLLVNNSTNSTGTGGVTVKSGATLSGKGKIAGTVTVEDGGTIAPGASIETLTSGSVTLGGINSHLAAELDFAGSGAADLLKVLGTVTLNNSTLNLSFANAPAFLAPTKFLLIDNDGSDAITGTFGIWTNPIGYAVTLDHAFTGTDSLGRIGNGNDLAITVQSLAAVPEPATVVVWGLVIAIVALGAKKLPRAIA